MPRLSIIIPVYNPNPTYLHESLSSIVIAAKSDSEILIGLDGLINNEIEAIFERFNWHGKSRPKLRIYQYEKRGIAETLNSLVRESDALYVARHDADDFCLPNRFDLQCSALDELSEIAFCGTQTTRCSEELKPMRVQRAYPCSFKGNLIYASLLNNPIAHPTLLIKRDVIDSVLYRNIDNAEDWDMYIRLWDKGYKSINLSKSCLLYRIHSEQITKKPRDLELVRSLKARSFEATLKHFSSLKYLSYIQRSLNSHNIAASFFQARLLLDLWGK
jgi:glycosyltransferase involved in cell wall biosynthesis